VNLLVDVHTQRLELLLMIVMVTVDIQMLIADLIRIGKPTVLFRQILFTNLTLKYLMPLPLILSMDLFNLSIQFRIIL
jgi:hypothetical protein